ncbi:Serine carboxypeptidase 44 [Hibiscus syriacus]|uniref:Serine carboxypeptidase 44 n=1 Tax=Hibiscus syriacus TaxID=106335 RepID=A0A6A2ZIW2_HIBSY|nr:mitogen-activated protein kinase kinase kinase 17-like [Hibiscus syriacus]KAE8690895.1 Serine carboxypeptidase 44 [Hibiscus syriacus]
MESGSRALYGSSSTLQWIKMKNLGAGSNGVVELVEMINPAHMLVAVKTSPLSVSSLEREYRILEIFFDCPYVVQCYVQFPAFGRDNLILEYAQGGDLFDLIEKYGGRIPESDVRCYTKMILQGLSFVHRRGYVHCDIKPENILVFPYQFGNRYNLKLADFGLAKEPGDDTWLTLERFRGTPAYMSPESVKNREITAALDIWSLGCVVVEMITGERPWESSVDINDLDSLATRIAWSRDIPDIPRNMSPDGRDFLMKCFARDLRERWTADRLMTHPFLTFDNKRSICKRYELF